MLLSNAKITVILATYIELDTMRWLNPINSRVHSAARTCYRDATFGIRLPMSMKHCWSLVAKGIIVCWVETVILWLR